MPSAVELSAPVWRMLRRVQLAGRPLAFAELRNWSRGAKEWSALRNLIEVGLLAPADPGEVPATIEPDHPGRFDLTPAGLAACDLGTYRIESWGKPGGPPARALPPGVDTHGPAEPEPVPEAVERRRRPAGALK